MVDDDDGGIKRRVASRRASMLERKTRANNLVLLSVPRLDTHRFSAGGRAESGMVLTLYASFLIGCHPIDTIKNSHFR